MSRRSLAQIYLSLVILAGAVLCWLSACKIDRRVVDANFLILAAIAIGLGPYLIVRIPRLTSQITVSDTFVFLTMLLYGGDAAVLLAALAGITASVRFSRKIPIILFNCAAMACATFITVAVLKATFGSIRQLPSQGFSGTFVMALSVMALVQYFANSGLVALAAALRLDRPVMQTWARHYLWTSATYVGGASAAGIVARLVITMGFYSVLVTVPIVAVIFLTYRIYGQNLEVAAAHATQAERHAEELSSFIKDLQRAEAERDHLFVREQQARAEAEKANQMKDEFLAMVTHELRTPLTPILGWIRMLRRGELESAAVADALESIERAARYQESIIDDLLDISRIVRGKLHLDCKEVELAQIIEDALEVVRPPADGKNISITFTNTAPEMVVYGDPRRLKQVVWNLLSNAVKFTPVDGRIDLQVSAIAGFAQIRVTDNGVGIRPDFLPFVFDRFRQDDTSGSNGLGGLGLGLALVHHLTEMHGGSVTAHSLGVGHGATFTLTLPLHAERTASISRSRDGGIDGIHLATELAASDLHIQHPS